MFVATAAVSILAFFPGVVTACVVPLRIASWIPDDRVGIRDVGGFTVALKGDGEYFPQEKARAFTALKVNIDTGELVRCEQGISTTTLLLDPPFSDERQCTDCGSINSCSNGVSIEKIERGVRVRAIVEATAGTPCLPDWIPSQALPSINYDFEVTIQRKVNDPSTIRFSTTGQHDSFPSYGITTSTDAAVYFKPKEGGLPQEAGLACSNNPADDCINVPQDSDSDGILEFPDESTCTDQFYDRRTEPFSKLIPDERCDA